MRDASLHMPDVFECGKKVNLSRRGSLSRPSSETVEPTSAMITLRCNVKVTPALPAGGNWLIWSTSNVAKWSRRPNQTSGQRLCWEAKAAPRRQCPCRCTIDVIFPLEVDVPRSSWVLRCTRLRAKQSKRVDPGNMTSVNVQEGPSHFVLRSLVTVCKSPRIFLIQCHLF